jgi:aminoglycoside phosphotransferase (APT) family kinase protein
MMVNDDFKVVAVMEWEAPSLGGALHDLGWWLYVERAQTVHQGLKWLEGMGTREETIALWSKACGKSAADMEWYEAFAAFKMEAVTIRMVQAKAISKSTFRVEPGTRTAELLEAVPGA